MNGRYFTWLGESSVDYNLIVSGSVSNFSPERDVTYVPVDGLDGELSLDKSRLKNTFKTFPVTSDELDIEENATNISNWLKSTPGWHDLVDSAEPKYVYRAQITEEYDVETLLKDFGKTVIKFTIKPYKFLKTGLDEIVLPATLANPTKREARPKITIKGTGNITLSIGSQVITLKSVDQGIVIDTLYDTVTTLDGNRPAWDKVTTYPLPRILPGKQSVVTAGNVTECKIVPRWEVIV